MANAQELARQIIDQMPDRATWHDIIYRNMSMKIGHMGSKFSDYMAGSLMASRV